MEIEEAQPVCVYCGQPVYPSDGTWTLISQAEMSAEGAPDLETQEILAVAHPECWAGEHEADA